MSGARRVLVVGALGRMGERVRAALEQESGLVLAAALEAPGHPGLGSVLAGGVEVRSDAKAALAGCEVAIDFSVPACTLATLRPCAPPRTQGSPTSPAPPGSPRRTCRSSIRCRSGSRSCTRPTSRSR
jgi:4-hydroxy-tetrahydrodipicolinate reductase